MVSRAKLYSRLDSLEAQLEESLVPHLRDAAAGNNDLVFCVTAFNPFSEFKHRTDNLTEELVSIGSLILSLRTKLDEPTQGSIAERICWYCREWGDSKNSPKASTVSLAKQFLAEIENNPSH